MRHLILALLIAASLQAFGQKVSKPDSVATDGFSDQYYGYADPETSTSLYIAGLEAIRKEAIRRWKFRYARQIKKAIRYEQLKQKL